MLHLNTIYNTRAVKKMPFKISSCMFKSFSCFTFRCVSRIFHICITVICTGQTKWLHKHSHCSGTSLHLFVISVVSNVYTLWYYTWYLNVWSSSGMFLCLVYLQLKIIWLGVDIDLIPVNVTCHPFLFITGEAKWKQTGTASEDSTLSVTAMSL